MEDLNVAVAKTENQATQEQGLIAKVVDLSLMTNANDFPELKQESVVPFDLISEYWTPETEGEERLCVFDRLEESNCVDNQTGEEKLLLCAFFYYKDDNGIIARFRNGSKVLTGEIENLSPVSGTCFKIRYNGRVKNKTNSNSSDRWSVFAIRD